MRCLLHSSECFTDQRGAEASGAVAATRLNPVRGEPPCDSPALIQVVGPGQVEGIRWPLLNEQCVPVSGPLKAINARQGPKLRRKFLLEGELI